MQHQHLVPQLHPSSGCMPGVMLTNMNHAAQMCCFVHLCKSSAMDTLIESNNPLLIIALSGVLTVGRG